MKQFAAHIREDGNEVQTIRDHGENVAEIAEGFSIQLLKDVVYDSGILHDIGKYQDSFQKRIRGERVRVDHSTAGAIEALKLFGQPAGLIMGYVIAGHHAGIPNGGHREDQPGEGINGNSLSARLKKIGELDDYFYYKEDGLPGVLRKIDNQEFARKLAKDCNSKGQLIDKFAFVVRFCYSCLVDADSLDTEHFCNPDINRKTLHSCFSKCLDDINNKFHTFICKTELQKARSVLQEQAYFNISKDSEIYMMNMPTGSGKTLCGTKCALMKALEKHRDRIIYIIPYNSIITQTVEELERIFGEDANILRHQSTYSIEEDENASDEYKIHVRQATENWNADLIVTTMVQFFETTFSNKRSKLRKMHNMSNSVLIFDEAHLMPLEFMQPCLETIVYLTRYANCTAVFLTATMPDYERLLKEYTFPDVKVVDLIPDKKEFRAFRKCQFHDAGILDDANLLKLCQDSRSVLIVVNSRKQAKRVYDLMKLDDDKAVYHLSTFMTKNDIQRNIDRIKESLLILDKGREDKQVVVVSTSLIEAGVDLDFETVFREYTGLDSILQAGGRCNREGKRTVGNVYVCDFEYQDGYSRKDDIKTSVTRSIIKEYEDISDPECIYDYFERVYLSHQDDITKNSMHKQNCNGITDIPFADYDGRIIRQTQQTVIVPNTNEAEKLVEQLQYAGISRTLLRRCQKYTCAVPPDMFQELMKSGVLDDYHTGAWVLTNVDYYNSETGINTEGKDYYI